MDPDVYMANQLLQIKNENAFLTFLTTLWLGKYVMIAWDRLNSGVMQIWGAEDLTEEQVDKLNEIVWEFMEHHKETT